MGFFFFILLETVNVHTCHSHLPNISKTCSVVLKQCSTNVTADVFHGRLFIQVSTGVKVLESRHKGVLKWVGTMHNDEGMKGNTDQGQI